jgi:hypothetical protein
MGVINRKEFKELKKDWEKIVPFEHFNFPFDPSLEKPKPKVKISGKFANQK